MEQTPAELERWLREHGPAMVLYARQWVNCHADAEDVFHDAFVRFWRNARSARNPTAYLYRCIRTAAIDWSRSPKHRDRDLDETASSMLVAAVDPVAQERRQLLEQALQQLPPEQREVVILKHWGRLTFEGIGDALDIPQRTAQSRYRYGVARLRELMVEESES